MFLLLSLRYWKWTVRFAAGQLSWTISVVTGLWSQVVSSVYHEDLILWSSSTVPGALSSVKHFTLAFSLRQVRQPLPFPSLASFFARSLRPFTFTAYFFSLSTHRVCSCPLSVAVRAHIGLFFWQEWKALSSCCLALCQYRQVARVWRRVRWLVPAVCRNQPINLQRHSTSCHLIALFTLISLWKQTLQNKVHPTPSPKTLRTQFGRSSQG